MGILDWLFGRKRRLPAEPEVFVPRPVEVPDSPNAREPFLNHPMPRSKRRWYYERTANLFWRNGRSKEPKYSTSIEPSPSRIEALGLPDLRELRDLAALLGVALKDLKQYSARPNHANGHYLPLYITKKNGTKRLLLAPKPRLKAIQRALHQKLVRKLPLNEAVHGFRRGRDSLSSASAHVGRDVVICMDIEEFFPSFDFRRVSGFFRAVGYSREVAVMLANLTTVAPDDVPNAESRYCRDIPQLPQGAPTSPGLANAICWRMDKRLAALAHRFGAEYTRYADDLTFSGHDDLADGANKFVRMVREILLSEGLYVNEDKTRIMRKSRQQRVTGVVVNERTNVSRREFDRLKAILHNCAKHGPGGQNHERHEDFAGHLRGRIAYFCHIGPERGRKLMRMFELINW
ncbi:MAG: RNA-directed DNA polymerase [Planctomycetes bacterium]|nr:RNA-directed DNA polymerase [Planctomycetota bacterium]